MCDLDIALTIGSTLLSAGGAIQQGQAANRAAQYNAQVQDMNAKIAERNARDAIERGQLEEQQKRQATAAVIGRQRAAMAANGVDIGFGSALNTLVDSAMIGEIDALTIRSNAAREAYAYDVDATNRRADAKLSRAQGRAAVTGSLLEAGGTLLTGAGKAYYQKKSPLAGR